MQPVVRHQGRAVTLGRNDVDTDQIIPAEYCKRLTKSGYDDVLFAQWRRDPDFALNAPAAQRATVLLGAHNFGTGSSREHAVWALRDWGFGAVLATSFGDIFLRNAWKNGLMAVILPDEALDWAGRRVAADPDTVVTVDLALCKVLVDEREWSFEVDEYARTLLMSGRDEISDVLERGREITAYEAARRPWLPKLERGRLLDIPAAVEGERP